LPYALRKASIGRKRAARQAGPNPPAVPITSASRSAAARSAAPTFSVITLMVKVAAPKPMPPRSMRRHADRPRAQTAPSTNPSPATASASTWNDVRIAAREKPRARSVPISAVRACTAAYLLLAAPHPAPDDRLTRARREHPPLHETHVVVHGERHGLDPSHEDVLAPSLAGAEEGLHDQLRRCERLVLRVACDAVEEADRLVGLERQLARPVVVRPLAHDDDVAGIAGRDERALEARDEPQEEAARDHDERDHARGHERPAPPRPHVAQAVGERERHV